MKYTFSKKKPVGRSIFSHKYVPEYGAVNLLIIILKRKKNC